MSWNLLDITTLRRIDLFDQVSDNALGEVAKLSDTRRYSSKEIIFREGDDGDALFFILKGKVRITKDITDVARGNLAELESGSSFGEMALIDEDEVRSANAVAVGDCHLGIIPRDEFMEFMEADFALATDVLWSFVSTLSDRLRESNDKLALLALSSLHKHN